MPRERLELDVGRALAALGQLDSALQAAAVGFSRAVQLAVQPQTVKVTADTKDIGPRVEGAVDEADTTATVEADVSQATTSIQGLKTETGGWVSQLSEAQKVLAGIGVAVGLRETLQFLKASTLAASDLNEAVNKAKVIFEGAAPAVLAFAEGANAIGLARSEAIGAAGDFGILFQEVGKGEEATANMSLRMVRLAADLASISNLPIDEALIRLRSGLVGEIEPLRRLGVSFNAVQVEAKAAQLGLVGANGELTEGAKIQARYQLILDKTRKQQGDFARTADDLANAMRGARAQFVEAQISLGTGLAPAATKATLEFRDNLAPALRDLFDPLGRIIGQFAEAGGGVLPIFTSVVKALTPTLEVLAAIIEQIPAPLLAAAVNFKILNGIAGTFGKNMKVGTLALLTILPLLGAIGGEAGEAATSMATLAAVGFQIGGGWGAAIGAALGLIASLFGDTRSEAEKLTDAIKELSKATDQELRRTAAATAAEIEKTREASTLAGDAFADAADEMHRNLIPNLKAMARESDAGAGAARRLGAEYVALGLITQERLNRAFRDLTTEQQRVTQATQEGAAVLATLPTSTELAEGAIASLGDVMADTEQDIKRAFGETAPVSVNTFIGALNKSVDELEQFNVDVFNLLTSGMEGLAAVIQQEGPGGAFADEIRGADPKVRAFWNQIVETQLTAQALGNQRAEIQAKAGIEGIAQNIDALRRNGTAFNAGYGTGLNFGSGLYQGIGKWNDDIQRLVAQMVRDAKTAADRAAGNASPSKLFAEVGANLTAGLAQGMVAGAPGANRAAAGVVQHLASQIGPITIRVQGVSNPADGRAVGMAVGDGLVRRLSPGERAAIVSRVRTQG